MLAPKQTTPIMRFPEFNDDWDVSTVKKISSHITSGSRDWSKYYSVSGDLFIRMTNLARNGDIELDLTQTKHVTLPQNGHEGTRTSLCPEDVLISITAELGKIGFISRNIGTAYINQHTALVRPDPVKVFPRFLAQSLATHTSNKRLNRLNDSGAKAGLNLSTIAGFKVAIPTIPEQQKIAAFLGAVDEKVMQLQKKKDLLEDYKKGCTQKLFSKELRFTDDNGNSFPDWEEKRLSDIAAKTSSTIKESDLELEGNYLVYGASGIAGYANTYASAVLHVGIVKDGAGVGRVILCPEQSSVLGTLDSIIARSDSDTTFVYYWLSQISFRPYVTGSTIPHIYFKDYGKIKAPFPCHEEQEKIANFLTAIDDKIALVAEELDKAKTFKKGLLQQMFV